MLTDEEKIISNAKGLTISVQKVIMDTSANFLFTLCIFPL